MRNALRSPTGPRPHCARLPGLALRNSDLPLQAGKIWPRMSEAPLSHEGLRYVKKAPGSIITTPRAESMMSCFKCCKFALRTTMTSKRFLGENHLVSAPQVFMSETLDLFAR